MLERFATPDEMGRTLLIQAAEAMRLKAVRDLNRDDRASNQAMQKRTGAASQSIWRLSALVSPTRRSLGGGRIRGGGATVLIPDPYARLTSESRHGPESCSLDMNWGRATDPNPIHSTLVLVQPSGGLSL